MKPLNILAVVATFTVSPLLAFAQSRSWQAPPPSTERYLPVTREQAEVVLEAQRTAMTQLQPEIEFDEWKANQLEFNFGDREVILFTITTGSFDNGSDLR